MRAADPGGLLQATLAARQKDAPVDAGTAHENTIGRWPLRELAPALWTAAFYFVAAEIGTMLALSPVPLPHLRPGAAVLLAALLTNPVRLWLAILLAIVPAHLLAQLHHGVPFGASLVWLFGNYGQALLGAGGLAWLLRERLRFDLLHHVLVFICWCAFVTPALVALPEVAIMRAGSPAGATFWQAWAVRVVASAAVVLAIVPPRVNRPFGTIQRIRTGAWMRQLEAGLLVLALLVLGGLAFLNKDGPREFAALATYAPLPVLFWTAIRFAPFGAEFAFLLFASFVVAGTASGAGPFAANVGSGGRLMLPLFLSAVAAPLLLLSAAIRERCATLATLRAEQEKLGRALLAERKREERLASERRARAEVEQRIAQRTAELRLASAELHAETAGRKRALEAERIAADRFSNLFRLSPDAMAISASVHGPLLDVNERWQQMFGYARDEALGRSADALNLYASNVDLDALAVAVGGQGAVMSQAVRMRDRHGRMLQTVFSGAMIEGAGDRCFLAIMRDVTEQRCAEAEAQRQREQLTHLTRVVVLGELSGALAHELNQPLAAILTNAQAARRFLSRPGADMGEIRDILDDIVAEDKRAGEVIRRLRALFKKEEPVLVPLDVSALVHDALELTHSSLVARNIGVRLELQDGLMVRADRVQLQQVLLNLVVNGCDAMHQTRPARRRLRIASNRLPDGPVEVTVADSGPGIAPDVIGRVFDPFFTTKAEGLGFGLSISRAIIVQHGGLIDVVNQPAGGCMFRIRLPAYSGET